MHAYIKLVKDILENGEERQDRTGVGTLSIFDIAIRDQAEIRACTIINAFFCWFMMNTPLGIIIA